MKELTRATYIFKIPDGIKNFTLYNKQGKIYFVRELKGDEKYIRVNICHHNLYRANEPFEIVERSKLQSYGWKNIKLPPPERNKVKDFRIEYNPNIGRTPARIFTDRGLIEIGKRFYDYPLPFRLFILLHEFGHFYYVTESLADLFALKMYLMLGYNESNAMYALTKILHKGEANKERILKLFDTIKNK